MSDIDHHLLYFGSPRAFSQISDHVEIFKKTKQEFAFIEVDGKDYVLISASCYQPQRALASCTEGSGLIIVSHSAPQGEGGVNIMAFLGRGYKKKIEVSETCMNYRSLIIDNVKQWEFLIDFNTTRLHEGNKATYQLRPVPLFSKEGGKLDREIVASSVMGNYFVTRPVSSSKCTVTPEHDNTEECKQHQRIHRVRSADAANELLNLIISTVAKAKKKVNVTPNPKKTA